MAYPDAEPGMSGFLQEERHGSCADRRVGTRTVHGPYREAVTGSRSPLSTACRSK
jgi:hypothetical protein